MTPAARLDAAITILDRILSGTPAEQALTAWARASRFAGSKDRAAIRDHVFDVLRCKRSCAHLGGAETGRGLILGLLRLNGHDPASLFTGEGHAPAPLSPRETRHSPGPMPELVALDCPDWLAGPLRKSLGTEFAPVLESLRNRAPVFLRVNTARITRPEAMAALSAAGITTAPHDLAPTALEITANPRALRQSAPYRDGLVELQDAASQAVIAALPALQDARVLDFCAGGGGKALALAALGANVTAHDIEPARMSDLPIRAARAQATIRLTDAPEGPFDIVLTDVPCSGSGAWRRSPAGKWALHPEGLESLHRTQSAILDQVAPMVRPGGWLCYATCSLLASENGDQITAFLDRHGGFHCAAQHRFTPLQGGDGFFLACLKLDTSRRTATHGCMMP